MRIPVFQISVHFVTYHSFKFSPPWPEGYWNCCVSFSLIEGLPLCFIIQESSTISSIISNLNDESKRTFINISRESIRLFFDVPSSAIVHQEISFPKHATRLQVECLALRQVLSHVIQSEEEMWEIWSTTKSALNAAFADGKQSALSLENRKSIIHASSKKTIKFIIYSHLNELVEQQFLAHAKTKENSLIEKPKVGDGWVSG